MTLKTVSSSSSGQGVLEYILMLFTVVFFFMIVVTGLARMEVTKKFMTPIKENFAAAYKYGDPKAKVASGGSNLPEQGHIRFNQHLFYDPFITN